MTGQGGQVGQGGRVGQFRAGRFVDAFALIPRRCSGDLSEVEGRADLRTQP